MTYVTYIFAVIGIVATTLFSIGLYMDVKDFDKTRGGYQPPYTGVTGEPVDWFALDRTPTGVAKRGYVLNVVVDGTTGMISFEFFKQKFDFRPFSGRALAVHKPREAFVEMGFNPEF